MKLRRSRNGEVIHAADCARAGRAVPWYWATCKTQAEVELAVAEIPWLRACGFCNPLAAAPGPDTGSDDA